MTGPGKIDAPLGSRKTRYAPRLPELTATALAALDDWFTKHPNAYVAISGGKDSTVCLDLARQVNPHVRAVMFDSGIEFPQTLRYVEKLAQHWNIEVTSIPAEPDALEVLAASGSWEHGVPKAAKDDLHAACILRPLAKAQERFGRASVYGLRADESKSRLMLLSKSNGYVTTRNWKGEVLQEYLAPIWRWSYNEVHTYLAQRSIPLNPVYGELIRRGVPERRARVGLAVDGWALDQGRWALTRAIAPDLARRVEARLPILAEWR